MYEEVTIGDTVVMVSIAPIYNLNLRAIFFLGNKEPNTYILDEGRVPIFGGENGRRGGINVGTWQVGTRELHQDRKTSCHRYNGVPQIYTHVEDG